MKNVRKVSVIAQTLVSIDELTLERNLINVMSVAKPLFNVHILLDITEYTVE